jgi:UDP-N-acetyl-2-amino-2-deoxyglucuronate dehydrogenase
MGSMSNHDKVYDNLIEVLQKGASISTNSFEGLKTVEIIEKIYGSAIRLDQMPADKKNFYRLGKGATPIN